LFFFFIFITDYKVLYCNDGSGISPVEKKNSLRLILEVWFSTFRWIRYNRIFLHGRKLLSYVHLVEAVNKACIRNAGVIITI